MGRLDQVWVAAAAVGLLAFMRMARGEGPLPEPKGLSRKPPEPRPGEPIIFDRISRPPNSYRTHGQRVKLGMTQS